MRIGWANGCFDTFHAGHRHFLRQAALRCDYLVVAVNSDRYCNEEKGPERPFWPLARRISTVRSFLDTLTDSAVIPFEGDEMALLEHVRPNVVFKGWDHDPRLKAMKFDGGRWIAVVHIDRLGSVSTSSLAQQRGGDDGGERQAR